MRTFIYIDGFNFYYGAVKNTPYKWIDFKALFSHLLDPKHKILSIKYFTAKVSGKIDPDQPVRQKTYIRALQKYIPEVEIHYGQFLTHNVVMPLACNIKQYIDRMFYVPVIKTEEKGSDVNLAVQLLNDSWENKFDCAIVVSNDSDLAEALKLVSQQKNKIIGVINPRLGKHPAMELMRYAKFYKKVRVGVLKISQLPDPIPGTNIRKPSAW